MPEHGSRGARGYRFNAFVALIHFEDEPFLEVFTQYSETTSSITSPSNPYDHNGETIPPKPNLYADFAKKFVCNAYCPVIPCVHPLPFGLKRISAFTSVVAGWYQISEGNDEESQGDPFDVYIESFRHGANQ